MNAIAHCVEVVYSPRRTPEAEAIALAGIRRLARALPAVVDDPDDVDARTDALAGAALAGRSLENATMGVHHGLAQLVGGRTGIPHGLANAVILAHAMRFNADVAPDEMLLIGEALGDPDDAAGRDRTSRRAARTAHAVEGLRRRRGRPRRGGPHVAVELCGAGEPPTGRRDRREGDPG